MLGLLRHRGGRPHRGLGPPMQVRVGKGGFFKLHEFILLATLAVLRCRQRDQATWEPHFNRANYAFCLSDISSKHMSVCGFGSKIVSVAAGAGEQRSGYTRRALSAGWTRSRRGTSRRTCSARSAAPRSSSSSPSQTLSSPSSTPSIGSSRNSVR